MRDDIVRHGLTATLASILASGATALLIVGMGQPAPPAPLLAQDSGSDETTLAALAEIRDAVRAVETAVSMAPVPVLPPKRAPARAEPRREESPASTADQPRDQMRRPAFDGLKRTTSEDVLIPVNEAGIRQLVEAYGAWDELNGDEKNDYANPTRRYLLLSVEAVVAEFGSPEHCRATERDFRCVWSGEGYYVTAHFSDGYCTRVSM